MHAVTVRFSVRSDLLSACGEGGHILPVEAENFPSFQNQALVGPVCKKSRY